MNDINKEEEIKKIIKNITALPTLPTTVTQLLSVLDKASSSAKDIHAIIAQDPSTTAKVLRLVNSAFYGLKNRVGTITQAIVILGFNTIRSLALSASVFDMFSEDKEEDAFDKAAFWEHSITCAVFARVLAGVFGGVDKEEVFIAGILHDIGKIILDEFANDELKKVINCMNEKKINSVSAELETLKLTHSDLGSWLGENWNLPLTFVEVLRFHHNPEEAEEHKRMVYIVHIADYLAHAIFDKNKYELPDLIEEIDGIDFPKNKIIDKIEISLKEIDKAKEMMNSVNAA